MLKNQFYSLLCAGFTFLVICLVGTENKATLSRKADMRLQLRSFAWHEVMVRWTHRNEDNEMWKGVNGNGWATRDVFMNSALCHSNTRDAVQHTVARRWIVKDGLWMNEQVRQGKQSERQTQMRSLEMRMKLADDRWRWGRRGGGVLEGILHLLELTGGVGVPP